MCLLAKKRKRLKSFWAESRGKNWNYLFYPSAKSRRELKIKTLGVTFRGASAYYVQKSIAPQKKAVCQFSDENFFDENFIENFRQFFFRRQKMKCQESSETRFPKVWGRTEPSSGGKRPFENSIFLAPQNFERPKNREGSSDFDDFWTKLIASTRSAFRKIFRANVFEKFSRKLRENFAKRGRWHARSAEK